MHMLYISNSFKCINSAKIEPLKFRPLLLKVSFSRPFQLMKNNCTESYVFFLARTYRARIQLSFTNTRCIQYSPYVNPCVSPYRVPNLTLGTKYKYIMNIKSGILNVPTNCNNPFRNNFTPQRNLNKQVNIKQLYYVTSSLHLKMMKLQPSAPYV